MDDKKNLEVISIFIVFKNLGFIEPDRLPWPREKEKKSKQKREDFC